MENNRIHRPGESRFKAIHPEELAWQPSDAAYPPGSVPALPGNTNHFHLAKSGAYVTQVTSVGPLGLAYVDPQDDPRSTFPAAR